MTYKTQENAPGEQTQAAMSALGQKRTFAKNCAQIERPPRGGLSEIGSDVFVTFWENGRHVLAARPWPV
jgi:hypothetical protein